MKIYFFLIYMITLSLFGAWRDAFKNREFGKAFISEIHSTNNKLEMGYDKNYDEYNIQEESSRFDRPIVIVDLGIDIPLYSKHLGLNSNNQKSTWSVASSLPISVHILEDMFEPITAPLLNTDFGFGSPQFNLIRRFKGDHFIKNISLSWLPYYHQCTHLGDEIIIYRSNIDLPITRINISYYYTELKLTINDPDGSREDNLNSFRFGLYYRVSDEGYGWFSVRPGIETKDENLNIKHSERRAEYYFDYRYQRTSGFLASKRAVNIFSMEIRNRVKLNYPIFKKIDGEWVTKDINESRVWSYNFYFGWKFYNSIEDNRGVGLFMRFYKGLNPFGQMRNNPNYRFLGVSLTYDI